MKSLEHIAEDVDALGHADFGTETVRVSQARLQHLRDIERLSLLFMDGLLDDGDLRRALESLVAAEASHA